MRAEKVYITEYVVEGFGEFPIDMLRYDCSCPHTEQDSAIITNQDGKRRVKLRAYQRSNAGPEKDRWKSFSWRVVEIQGAPV